MLSSCTVKHISVLREEDEDEEIDEAPVARGVLLDSGSTSIFLSSLIIEQKGTIIFLSS